MKIELPEKFVKEPTGYPFSPVLSIEGKEEAVTWLNEQYEQQKPLWDSALH